MSVPRPVLLEQPPVGASVADLESLADAAIGARGDLTAALALARDHAFPLPGAGDTRRLWESLATVASVDLTVARTLEPHLDAEAVLTQAGLAGLWSSGTWGVYAAEGPGPRLEAREEGEEGGRTRLDGRKPWCSLAGSLSHALVTAWCGPTTRGLYAVELGDPGVVVWDAPWVARGLTDVPSGPLSFNGVEATPVGGPGWYLDRPGFAWGGIGVAAIWFGGTVGVARRLLAQAAERELDQIGQMHLGAVDAAIVTARTVLRDAAAQVDAGLAEGPAGAILALRCRQVVAAAAERVLERVDHALGPAPLALEREHAARVADLRLYLRQEHAERDQAALGRALLASGPATPPW